MQIQNQAKTVSKKVLIDFAKYCNFLMKSINDSKSQAAQHDGNQFSAVPFALLVIPEKRRHTLSWSRDRMDQVETTRDHTWWHWLIQVLTTITTTTTTTTTTITTTITTATATIATTATTYHLLPTT